MGLKRVGHNRVTFTFNLLKKKTPRDFPDGPVVRTSHSNERGEDSIPGQRTKILHASWPKTQNIKQKQYCNKFNKDFYRWSTPKVFKKEKKKKKP